MKVASHEHYGKYHKALQEYCEVEDIIAFAKLPKETQILAIKVLCPNYLQQTLLLDAVEFLETWHA